VVERVTTKNEISLNGVRYPIKGRVSQSLASVLPAKVTIGEYSLADEQIASTWVINDQRGGLGVEEMDESVHQDRFYWSTCDTRYKGHITLNPLVTQATDPTHTSPTVLNADFETNDTWLDGGGAPSQSTNQARSPTHSWWCQTNDWAYQEVAGYIPGIEYTFTCWAQQVNVYSIPGI